MLQATYDWYYGSAEEEYLGDCQFGEPYLKKDVNKSSDIIVKPGTYENGESVNIFTKSRNKSSESSDIETCIKHLKILRHPNILRFVTSISMEIEHHLITEHAYPLESLIDLVDAHEICSGLHDIALAMQFIHEKAHVSHNNICIESIYVHDSGPWKLGAFDFACQFQDATKENLHKNPHYNQPPEENKPNGVLLPVKDEHAHCRDVYMFGNLLEQFFEKVQFATSLLKNDLQDVIDDIKREDYENRPTFKEILTMSLFKSAYISIIHFLQSITLRTKSEKEEFFKKLLLRLDSNHIFSEVIGRRIIPLLLTPIVLSEQAAVNFIIKDILSPANERLSNSLPDSGLIPQSLFARYVIPKIVELFKSRLIHVRVVLLENFSKFVHLFEDSVLKDIILPEIILGLNDINNQVVQCSLHALADVIPIVGAEVIIGSEREKIFSPGIPKFDGRILNESTTLAYKEEVAPRKKLVKRPPTPEMRKPTLLELATIKKNSKVNDPAPTVEVLLKQKQLAHKIAEKSQQMMRNEVDQRSFPKLRTPAVAQVVHQPDVETWASSDDEDSDMAWPELDELPSVNSSSLQTDSFDDKVQQTSIQKPFYQNKNCDISVKNHRTSNNLGHEYEINVKQPMPFRQEKEKDFFKELISSVETSVYQKEKTNCTPQNTVPNASFNVLSINDEENGWSDDGWDEA